MCPKSNTTDRFVEAVNYLTNEGIVKSKRQIANAIGISPSLITEAQKGRTHVSLMVLVKLTETYRKISVDYLLNGKEPMVIDPPLPNSANTITSEVKQLKDILASKEETIKSLQETIKALKKQIELMSK